jgi:hypothetical protein
MLWMQRCCGSEQVFDDISCSAVPAQQTTLVWAPCHVRNYDSLACVGQGARPSAKVLCVEEKEQDQAMPFAPDNSDPGTLPHATMCSPSWAVLITDNTLLLLLLMLLQV